MGGGSSDPEARRSTCTQAGAQTHSASPSGQGELRPPDRRRGSKELGHTDLDPTKTPPTSERSLGPAERSQLATWEEGCPGNRSPGGPWRLGALPGASVSNIPQALSHLTTEHPCSAERGLAPGTGHTGFLPARQSGGQQDSIGAPGGSGDARVCMELPGETLSTTARDVLKGNGCSLSLEGKTLPAPKRSVGPAAGGPEQSPSPVDIQEQDDPRGSDPGCRDRGPSPGPAGGGPGSRRRGRAAPPGRGLAGGFRAPPPAATPAPPPAGRGRPLRSLSPGGPTEPAPGRRPRPRPLAGRLPCTRSRPPPPAPPARRPAPRRAITFDSAPG